MSMVLMDLYTVKMDQDISQTKEEKVEVATNRVSNIIKSLRKKHRGKGIIVPHLEVIGKAFCNHSFTKPIIPEEKVVPGMVVFFSIIYFVVAAAFYNFP